MTVADARAQWSPVGVEPASDTTEGLLKQNVLASFHTALGKREASPMDIVIVGNSLTEGQEATTTAKRALDRLKDSLRARYQFAGVTRERMRPSYYQALTKPAVGYSEEAGQNHLSEAINTAAGQPLEIINRPDSGHSAFARPQTDGVTVGA
jgi:hypothetical protein